MNATTVQPDRQLIEEHLAALHQCAEGLNGLLVLAAFGEDPMIGQALPPLVEHFAIGDVDAMTARAAEWTGQQHRNVYASLVVMRADLPTGKKGDEDDLVKVLGLVADFDDADASQWPTRSPIQPTAVLQTSPGRFQVFFLFTPPFDPAIAKPLAIRLQRHAGCDFGTKDLSHVWRIAGTLNWPNRRKVQAGRSPEPFVVTEISGGTNQLIDPTALDAALPLLVPPVIQVNHRPAQPVEADDQTLVDKMLDAANGAKVQTLWQGDWSAYPSQSEGDSALCCHLAFWCGRDEARIDRLFRQSGLFRDKWDTRRGDTTYGAETVRRACASCSETYRATHPASAEALDAARPYDDTTGEAEPTEPPPDSPIGTFAPISVSQLLDEHEPAQPTWIWEDILPEGALAALVAKPKVGKTTLAYELGVKVAQGLPFLGRSTQRSPVLFLSVEEHRREVKRRLRTLEADHLETLHVHTGPLDDSASTLHALRQFIGARGIKLVILDTLNSFWSIQEENDAVHVTQALKPLLSLARESGAAVLLLHHARKSEGEHGDEIRGSGALFSLLDVALILKRHEVETQRKLTSVSRYPDTPPELIIELRDHGYECLGDPATTGKAAKLTKLASALTEKPTEVKPLALRAGVAVRSAYPLLEHLFSEGRALRTGEGKRKSPFLYSLRAYKDEGLHETNSTNGDPATKPLALGGDSFRASPHSKGHETKRHDTVFVSCDPRTPCTQRIDEKAEELVVDVVHLD